MTHQHDGIPAYKRPIAPEWLPADDAGMDTPRRGGNSPWMPREIVQGNRIPESVPPGYAVDEPAARLGEGGRDGDTPRGPQEDGDASREAQQEPPAGYDRVAAAREDYADAARDIRTITRELRRFAESLPQTGQLQEVQREQLRLAERQLREYQRLTALLEELLSKGRDQDPGVGFSAATRATALDGETKDAEEQWPQSIWKEIRKTLRRLLPRVWSMISHLLQVKEWSLEGQVGAGVIGWAQAGISVTFGKP
jgi:hypothetical protein